MLKNDEKLEQDLSTEKSVRDLNKLDELRKIFGRCVLASSSNKSGDVRNLAKK